MQAIDLNALELLTARFEGDPTARWDVTFPFFAATGTESLAVLYFEIEAGNAVGTHTDSAEEVVLVLDGEVEASLNDETERLGAGGMVLIPVMASHQIRNVGSTKARCLGFFASANVVSTFEKPVLPVGERVLDTAVLGESVPTDVNEDS